MKRVSVPLVTMALVAFMATNHTKVYNGYDHQSNIGMMSALLLGWKRLENKNIDFSGVDMLKIRPNTLINNTFNLIEKLDPPVIRDTETNYNSFALLDKFAQAKSRQVVVLQSPMNDADCALDDFNDVPFQVHYATAKFGNKRPIVLWETHLIDDQDVDRVHYHTIVYDTFNVNQALMDAGIFDHFDPYNVATVEKFALSKYEFDELPDAFHGNPINETVEEWITRIDQRRGPIMMKEGYLVPIEPLSMEDIVTALDEWADIIRRTKADEAARKASIKSGDYGRRFDHISKDIDPSTYTYAMRVHATYCKACPV